MGKSLSYRFTVRCAVDLTDLAEEESESSAAPHGFESMTNLAEDYIGDVQSEFLQEVNDWEPISYGTYHLPSSQALFDEWNQKGYEYSTHAHISYEKDYEGNFAKCWQEFKSDYIAALDDFDDEDFFSLTLVDIYDPLEGKSFYPSRTEASEVLETVNSELQQTLVGKRFLSRYNDIEGNRDKILDNIDLFWGDLLIHFNEMKDPDVHAIIKAIPKMKESKILGLEVPPAFELRDLPESSATSASQDSAQFCDQCGAKRKNETSKFCSSCGAGF